MSVSLGQESDVALPKNLTDYWLKISISCYPSLSIELLTAGQFASTEKGREGISWSPIFCNLILKVTAHPFFHILFIGSESLGPVHTQGEGTRHWTLEEGSLRPSQRVPPEAHSRIESSAPVE